MTDSKLNCLCIDDETHALDLLEMYIQKTPFLTLSMRTTDAWEGLNYAEKNEVDVLFLDIQMDTLNGIQFMEILKKKTNIILTTAYEKYALKGYEFQVKDYLLKPYSYARFLKSVLKIQEDKTSKSDLAKTDPLHVDGNKNDDNDFLLIKSDAKHKFFRIRKSDILYIESLRNYVRFYTADQKIMSLQTLSQTNEQLGKPFQRIHKSYIINMEKIDLIDGNTIYIHKESIPIGNSYRKDFFELIKK